MSTSLPFNRNTTLEPYGDLIDLYAQRAVKAKTVLIADAKPIPVIPVGRGSASEMVRKQVRTSTKPATRLRSMAASLATSFGF